MGCDADEKWAHQTVMEKYTLMVLTKANLYIKCHSKQCQKFLSVKIRMRIEHENCELFRFMRNPSFLLLSRQYWQDPFYLSSPCTVATFSHGSSPSQPSPCSLSYTRHSVVKVDIELFTLTKHGVDLYFTAKSYI